MFQVVWFFSKTGREGGSNGGLLNIWNRLLNHSESPSLEYFITIKVGLY